MQRCARPLGGCIQFCSEHLFRRFRFKICRLRWWILRSMIQFCDLCKKRKLIHKIKHLVGWRCCNERTDFGNGSNKSEICSHISILIWVWRRLHEVSNILSSFVRFHCISIANSFWINPNIRFGFGADTSEYPFEGGIAHQDDLIYLFPYPPNVANLNAKDKQVAKQMVDLWTSFVRDGVPKLTSNTSFVWRPLSSMTMTTTRIVFRHFVLNVIIYFVWCLGETGPFLHIDKELDLDDDFIDEFFST